jgi:hypothetical protein
MKYPDCSLKYIGKTGRTFNIRYKEHVQAIINNNSNSGYFNLILRTGHTYRAIADTLDIIKTGNKSRHLNSFRKTPLL